MASARSRSFKPGADHTLGYTETLMYGHYTSLKTYARKEGAKIKEQKRKDTVHIKVPRRLYSWTDVLFGRFVQDWVFLTLLGVTVAVFSFTIDILYETSVKSLRWLYGLAEFSVVAQYFVWVLYPLVFICFSVGFTHIVSPVATGSGIPEVKTIMKGVILKECLTLRTLVAKVIGLATALMSGMPLGKLGPFVHVASVSAAVLSKLFSTMRHQLENESLNIDILTAAAAVGVSSTFACPIGGVLFSIEVTATYFAVRNYWRGFYSAVCGAITFQLLSVWFRQDASLTALFRTNLRIDVPYRAVELVSFSVLGAIGGLLGAMYVFTHKGIVLYVRRRKRLTAFLQRNRFIYPVVITVAICSVTFPPGSGQFMGGYLQLREAVSMLFDNRTWSTQDAENIVDAKVLNIWRGPLNNVHLTLFLFLVSRFWMCASATTMALPCGIFIPAFTLGASAGRLFGELMATWFPSGIGGDAIIPACYAMVGAAAFSGAMTHTVSTAVIVFETTGQLGHIIPTVIAVMIANVVAHYLQPSVYDAMIIIKKLPFLPPTIDPDVCNAHQVYAEDFMARDVHFLTIDSTYADAFHLINAHRFRAFPVVDSKENMLLLGAIQRKELKRIIEEQFSEHRRLEYFTKKTRTGVNADSPYHSDPTRPLLSDNGRNTKDGMQSKEVQAPRPAGSAHRFSVTKAPDGGLTDSKGQQPSETGRKYSWIRPDMASNDWTRKLSVTAASSQKEGVKFVLPSEHKKEIESKTSESLPLHPDLEWEFHQLRQHINFEECYVDPAPFQITDMTSLYKVHTLFSLLSLHHAFVTSNSRLVGVVSLTEVRKAIQGEIEVLPAIIKQVKHESSPGR